MKQIILVFLFLLLIISIRLIKHTTQKIIIDGHSFDILVARTQEEQEKGLGERESLPSNMGMLFPFDHPYREGFWMKGMHFPIDIIYIKTNHIISIFEN